MSQQMTLEMLRVQVGLVAVRARVFSIGVLLRYHVLGGLTTTRDRRVRATRRAGKDTTTALRTNHMCRSLLVLHELRLLTQVRESRKATHRATDASRRHWPDCR